MLGPKFPRRFGRITTACASLAIIGCAALVLIGSRTTPSRADTGGGSSAPHPTLGTLDRGAVLMGAATGGDSGDVWAYRALPQDVPPPSSPSTSAQFAPSTGSPFGQLVFERYTDSTGVWSVVETPQQAGGQPYRGFTPNPLSARITPNGGGVLIGSDPTQPPRQRVVVLAQDPGGRFTVLPQPDSTVLHPAAGVAAEVLATNNGTGRVAASAVENSGHTELFVGIVGPPLEQAVAHWDGSKWTREPIVIPANSSNSFQILAIDGTGTDNMWLLAKEDAGAGTGIALYHRVQGSSGPEWDRATMPATPFDAAASASKGIANVTALTGQAQPLTVAPTVVWVDLRFTASSGGGHGSGGTEFDATIGYDLSANTATTFCDANDGSGNAICGHPLGFEFDDGLGYRSFAFGGSGLGSRVITDTLPADAPDGTINDGSYARIDGTTVTLMPGGAPSLGGGAAFSSPAEGWLPGPVHISSQPAPNKLSSWPLQARSPLTGIAEEPGTAPGALNQEALAVGTHGVVERYVPGQGWQREFLLTSNGSISSQNLRAVAWPEPGRAYAVGDLGAMWLWQSATGFWEPDPGAPLDGFQANLEGIAFSPTNPALGYAVGLQGTLLRYDKTWTQEPLPSSVANDDFTSVAFAGGQALVAAGGDLLENSGAGWSVDECVHNLLASLPNSPTILTVAGLPDGGAVAAGHDIVLERDSLTSPWRVSDQPLPGYTVIAASAIRAGARIQAIVSVQPQIPYPPALPTIITDPNSPPPLIPPNPLPASGYILRETSNGWVDDQQTSFSSPTDDKSVKTDPIAAFDLGPDGSGWAVGGWSGEADDSGRGSSASGGAGQSVRDTVSTSGIYRYQPAGGPSPAPVGASVSPITFPTNQANFIAAGDAACADPCSDLRDEELAPDQNLTQMMGVASGLVSRTGGPRMLLYTGGRVDSASGGLSQPDSDRFAQLFQTQPSVPVFPAISPDISSGGNVSTFSNSFSGFPAPFGSGAAPNGVLTGSIPAGASATSGVRTHYAFDSTGPAGTVRVVVIDNSRGSLAASDPYQNPPEPQTPWLESVLADAKQRGIPVIVMGNRDLNSKLVPQINVASDADSEAKIFAQGGVSAYLYDRPEEQRTSQIPAGGSVTIPEYGTGTLGYRSPLSNTTAPGQADSLFGQTGYLIVSVNVANRNPNTNVAPVTATLEPLLQDLSIQALDGTLLRRSHPYLFQALGRRPIAGDRWGPTSAGDATPNPPGADPYTTFPPDQCLQANCSSMITPTYTFKSSRPDIANFVEQDPNSQDLRKPLQGSNGKPIASATSGLLCAFNAGNTTISVTTGGLTASVPITILSGSVEQPCGTVPLLISVGPPRGTTTPPPPPITVSPGVVLPPPPPAAPVPPPPPQPVAVKAPPPKPVPAPPKVFIPLPPAIPGFAPATFAVSNGVLAPPPPPAGAFARPIPPGGATVRVYEEKREEEAAPEQSQAFAAYHPDEGPGIPMSGFVVGVVLIGAAAGASIRPGLRRRDRRQEAAIAAAQVPIHQQRPRRYR